MRYNYPRTSFNDFMEGIDAEPHELYFLRQSILNPGDDFTLFKAEETDKGLVVRCSYSPNQLLLTTEKAKKWFLQVLDDDYADGDVEMWYFFHEAINKPD